MGGVSVREGHGEKKSGPDGPLIEKGVLPKLFGEEAEDVGGLFGRAAFVVGVNDFAIVHEVGGAAGHHEALGSKGCRDDFFGVGEEGEGEVIFFLEGLLGGDGVVADADDGDTLIGEGFVGITQGAALFGAAGSVGLGVEVNQGIVVIGVNLGEIQGGAGVGESRNFRGVGAHFERSGGAEVEEGHKEEGAERGRAFHNEKEGEWFVRFRNWGVEKRERNGVSYLRRSDERIFSSRSESQRARRNPRDHRGGTKLIANREVFIRWNGKVFGELWFPQCIVFQPPRLGNRWNVSSESLASSLLQVK